MLMEPMLTIEQIAKVVHHANLTYCQALGDYSQVIWDAAPQWQRDSVIAGVKAALDDPDTTPEESHERWCERKLAEGWMFGPTKDPVRKTHPCLVGYDSLPPEQRVKDGLFLAIVQALAPQPEF